jgi:hypothetical protein
VVQLLAQYRVPLLVAALVPVLLLLLVRVWVLVAMLPPAAAVPLVPLQVLVRVPHPRWVGLATLRPPAALLLLVWVAVPTRHLVVAVLVQV